MIRREDLADRMRAYLEGKVSHEAMRELAWSQIEDPGAREYVDRAFWNAIWTLQHVADEEHWANGVTRQEVSRAVDFLNNPTSMPDDLIGRGP